MVMAVGYFGVPKTGVHFPQKKGGESNGPLSQRRMGKDFSKVTNSALKHSSDKMSDSCRALPDALQQHTHANRKNRCEILFAQLLKSDPENAVKKMEGIRQNALANKCITTRSAFLAVVELDLKDAVRGRQHVLAKLQPGSVPFFFLSAPKLSTSDVEKMWSGVPFFADKASEHVDTVDGWTAASDNDATGLSRSESGYASLNTPEDEASESQAPKAVSNGPGSPSTLPGTEKRPNEVLSTRADAPNTNSPYLTKPVNSLNYLRALQNEAANLSAQRADRYRSQLRLCDENRHALRPSVNAAQGGAPVTVAKESTSGVADRRPKNTFRRIVALFRSSLSRKRSSVLLPSTGSEKKPVLPTQGDSGVAVVNYRMTGFDAAQKAAPVSVNLEGSSDLNESRNSSLG